MTDCLFCDFIRGEKQPHRVWENERFLAFLDINPIQPGHTLLVPKGHTEYLFDLDDAHYADLLLAAKSLSEPIRRATAAERIGLIVEGFEVPHIHIHLVPLYGPKELTPEKGRPADAAELRAMAARIAAAIAGRD